MSSSALAELAAARPPSGTAAPPERFSLLLLEDGEYSFRSHTAYYWPPDSKRVVGSLKVCSRSLFFVPRDVQQPIFRIAFQDTSAVEALEEAGPHGEDQFEVVASTRVDMQAGGVDAPYVHHQGDFRFRFSLVYASLEDALPLVEELLLLAHRMAAAGTAGVRGGEAKAVRTEVAEAMAEIIKDHEEAEQFNPGWLEEEESVVTQAPASAISPLAAQPGRAVLTQQRIYFQPFGAGVCAAPLQAYALSKVVAVAPRVHQLEDLGLEVFFSSRHSLYLAFRAPEDRARFQRLLMQQPALQLDKMRSREQWTRDWVNGRISNFDYLMHLNREAGRSFKDLSQYPVMPWVVADYSSPTLDLSDPATYRDLSKPIGALNPRRLADFQKRFLDLKGMMDPEAAGDAGGGGWGSKRRGGGKGGGGRRAPPPGAPPPLDTPPFLYGCHYSSPGYVVFYLMRSDPQLMLRLQNGRFDAPDRLFWSIADTWKSVLTLPSDVKELIPEFYSNDPAFLLNRGNIDFGCRSGGQRVGDVALPPWASDARDFLWKLQEALESPHVSARLHKWIDLVFGRKARGAAAEKANNVFHYMTYDEVALRWLEGEADPGMRDALRLQMMEFGRTPRQLFTGKHPKRRVLGRGGIMSCFAFFSAPIAAAPRPTNQLTGKPYDARSIPPVSRAVFKLSCTPQSDKRRALLAFLENTAAVGEPDALALRQTRGAELFLLVKAAREARERRPGAVGPPDEMAECLARAVAALAGCPQNRRYILEAGCLDAVADALGAAQPATATAAAQALALLAQEQSARLQALDSSALERLMGMLRQPPSPEALLAALTAITFLSDAYPAHRAFFARHDLLALLQQQLQSSSEQAASAAAVAHSPRAPNSPQPAARPDSRGGLLAGYRAESRALRRRATQGGGGFSGGGAGAAGVDVQPSLLRRQRLLAMAMLLQDEAQKEAFLAASAALPALLADCSSASLAVRGGAFDCLAALTASDAMRQLVQDLRLLPLLLEGAACSSIQVQQPAAAAIANLCTDPALVLAGVAGEPGGLAPVVALALSSDEEVQRSAAAALWHLAVHPEARAAAVEAGALSALLGLALESRSVPTRDLARQGLMRCCSGGGGGDAAAGEAAGGARARLETLAAARGVDAGQVSALLSPSSARSLASGSSLLRKAAHHRKMNSEVPSSLSGAVSRSSSFRSARSADASPSYCTTRATIALSPGGDMSSQASASPSPLAPGVAAAAAAAAASSPALTAAAPASRGPELAVARELANGAAAAAAARALRKAGVANGSSQPLEAACGEAAAAAASTPAVPDAAADGLPAGAGAAAAPNAATDGVQMATEAAVAAAGDAAAGDAAEVRLAAACKAVAGRPAGSGAAAAAAAADVDGPAVNGASSPPKLRRQCAQPPCEQGQQALEQELQQLQQQPLLQSGKLQRQPSRLQVPKGPPLPLPIITPVAAPPGSPPRSPGKQQQLQQQQGARAQGSTAAAEAAATSPKGVVATRVQQLERAYSGQSNNSRSGSRTHSHN